MADVQAILAGKYPAKAHAKRVVEWMKKKNPQVSGTLYLEGQKTQMIEDNDESMPFRLVLLCLYDLSLTAAFADNGGSSTT